jgi:MFS family permease
MEKVKQILRESKVARWTALGLVSFTMLCGYLFTELISPLKPYLESNFGWDPEEFGIVTSAYGWFNVFLLMLIIGGIILDKMGVRFTSILSASIMIIGAGIKYYAFIHDFGPGATIIGIDAKVIIAATGYAIFGVGVEMAGITVSKIIVRWFMGKELALAMGLEMAVARLGSFVALAFSPLIAERISISAPILLGLILLCIGLITFIVYFVMDVRLQKQDEASDVQSDEESFHLSDIRLIIANRGFWYIALLCVLFYSAVFPFYKFGPDLMVNKFGINARWAGLIPSLLPFGTLFLTPLFGNLYDRRGKGASIMVLGAVMLILVHFTLWIPPLHSVIVAIIAVIFLGIAFSLVPSAMWPSVPKIIPEKSLGTAYAIIFWVQNWGLMGIPYLLGLVLKMTNPEIVALRDRYRAEFLAQGLTDSEIAEKFEALRLSGDVPPWEYAQTWLIFIALTVLALIFAFLLKREDRIKNYGLQKPNIDM